MVCFAIYKLKGNAATWGEIRIVCELLMHIDHKWSLYGIGTGWAEITLEMFSFGHYAIFLARKGADDLMRKMLEGGLVRSKIQSVIWISRPCNISRDAGEGKACGGKRPSYP